MAKFVVKHSFLHEHVLHPGGEIIDLSEYEARRLGHVIERVGSQAAAMVKPEARKAEEQRAVTRQPESKKSAKKSRKGILS